MAIAHRVSKLEKRLAMTSTDESHKGELLIVDSDTGEVLQRTALECDVRAIMPDNKREPLPRERPGSYVNLETGEVYFP